MMVIVMVLDTFNIKSLRDALECDLCSSLTYDENCNCIFCGEHNERLEHKLKKLDNCFLHIHLTFPQL